MNRRWFLGSLIAAPLVPLKAIYADTGKDFPIHSIETIKLTGKLSTQMTVNGKWILGPSPCYIFLITKKDGSQAVEIECSELKIKPIDKLVTLSEFRLLDTAGEIISERKIDEPITLSPFGFCEEWTLALKFTLDVGLGKTAFEKYMANKMYRELRKAI